MDIWWFLYRTCHKILKKGQLLAKLERQRERLHVPAESHIFQHFNIILLLADEHVPVLATYIKFSEESRFRRSRKAEIHSEILIIISAIHVHVFMLKMHILYSNHAFHLKHNFQQTSNILCKYIHHKSDKVCWFFN